MDTDIEEVKQDIRKVELEIREVGQDIRKVEQQIEVVEGLLTKAVAGDDVAYWRKEEQLRQKEQQLRKEKEQLRKEKEQLRQKEQQLRQKEDRLREEKLVLHKTSTSELRFRSRKLVGHVEEGMNARRDSYCSMRVDTIGTLCELVDEQGAILIRAPPGSGKTSLLQLVAQIITPEIFENVYYISLAELSGCEKTFESLWAQWHPGVNFDGIRSPPKCTGTHSERRPNLLLVDEGQAAFDKNLSLWGTLKSVMGGFKPHLRMIVVSAWGSAIVVSPEKCVHTPACFNRSSTVGLWPTDDISVSLQLTSTEATELWKSWCQRVLVVGDELAPFDDLREYIFNLTERQPGLMVHVLDWLKGQGLHNLHNLPADSKKEKVRSLLLSSSFYESLSSLRSLYRLNKAIMGEEPNSESMRSMLRLLVREEPGILSVLRGPALDAANLAVKWGQLIEDGGRFYFPSRIHELFLYRELYCSRDSTIASIEKEGILEFVRRVIERLDPRRLKLSESRNAKDGRVYERQYQNEFYRAVCTIIPKDAALSPDVGPLYGATGYLDFLLSPLRWGFELLRDGSKAEEHMERFNTGGTYGKLLQDKVVEQFVILDLRMKPLVQDVQAGLWHVVFSKDFGTATLHIFGSEPETIHVGGALVAPISQHTG